MASPASIEMIRRLVSHDTTSRLSNFGLIEEVRDYLKRFGIESELVHDESGLKSNLYATIGPTQKAGICLSGHTDVVPVDGHGLPIHFAWKSKMGNYMGGVLVT